MDRLHVDHKISEEILQRCCVSLTNIAEKHPSLVLKTMFEFIAGNEKMFEGDIVAATAVLLSLPDPSVYRDALSPEVVRAVSERLLAELRD
eukprot:1086246_1